MEQITRHKGVLYYGKKKCIDAEEVYQLFRTDYHASCGRVAWSRLDRLGQRTERVHEFGLQFLVGGLETMGGDYGRVPCRLLGLMGISYCYTFGIWNLPELTESETDKFVDILLTAGSRLLKKVGRKDKAGITNKRLNARYK